MGDGPSYRVHGIALFVATLIRHGNRDGSDVYYSSTVDYWRRYPAAARLTRRRSWGNSKLYFCNRTWRLRLGVDGDRVSSGGPFLSSPVGVVLDAARRWS